MPPSAILESLNHRSGQLEGTDLGLPKVLDTGKQHQRFCFIVFVQKCCNRNKEGQYNDADRVLLQGDVQVAGFRFIAGLFHSRPTQFISCLFAGSFDGGYSKLTTDVVPISVSDKTLRFLVRRLTASVAEKLVRRVSLGRVK